MRLQDDEGAAVLRDVTDGHFSLAKTTERHLVEFAKKDGYNAYFQDHFALSTRSEICPHQKWEALFAKPGDIGTLKGKVPTGVTAGVLRLLKYGSRAQLEVLAKLCGHEEGFDEAAVELEARRRLQKLLENWVWFPPSGYFKFSQVEEEVLDGVFALGRAEGKMNIGKSKACYERAKEGFVRLLEENSAKAVKAAFKVASQNPSVDEMITEYRRLWERAKVSLPVEVVTFDLANDLGCELDEKGQHEEAKVFYLAALVGRRRVLGEKHKDTLCTLNNLGIVLQMIQDWQGALDYFLQALRVQEKVLRKTHPHTLGTIMNMAAVYGDGLGDRVKDEEMLRLALDGYEKSLGKDHEDTKECARNLAILLKKMRRLKEKVEL